MTAPVIDLADRMSSAAARTRATIRAIKGYRQLNDGALAALLGMGRTKVNNYLTGTTRITVEMLAAFADALHVPEYVLAMDTDEALKWVLDNSPNGPGTTADHGKPPTYCETDGPRLRAA